MAPKVKSAWCCVLLLACVSLSQGYEMFRTKIPNADLVSHPCKLHYTWPGLGHRHPRGGGERNQFGLDFLAAGKQWTPELCSIDSDGDGKSNGEELGDPHCVWRQGKLPNVTSGITHPGICDPWGSYKCNATNSWVSCETEEFSCNFTKESHVQQKLLKFPPVKIPSKETNYYCMTFDLPDDKDYHLIATEPQIDNIRAVHHMRLMGCSDGVPERPVAQRCYMGVRGCSEMIGAWTVGMSGQCLYWETGFKIGLSGYKRVLLEIHWNNPQLRNDWIDESGIRIYYTPQLRRYDAGVLWLGQERLFLPPGQSRVSVEATCPSQCTQRNFKQPIYVTDTLNHMHYMGISEKAEQIRDGKRVNFLTNEEFYSYDNPVFKNFNPPVELKPGDTLKTTCVYRTLSSRVTTQWGEGTQDEMCYAILVFFPRSAVSRLYYNSWGDYSNCMVDSNGTYNGCHVRNFHNIADPETKDIYDKVLRNCDYKYGTCRPECPDVLAEVKKHPCLQGDVGAYILHKAVGLMGMKFATALRSCDCPALTGRHNGMSDMTSSSNVAILSSGTMLLILVPSVIVHSSWK